MSAEPAHRLEDLSVRALKDLLQQQNIPFADCFEKADLVARLRDSGPPATDADNEAAAEPEVDAEPEAPSTPTASKTSAAFEWLGSKQGPAEAPKDTAPKEQGNKAWDAWKHWEGGQGGGAGSWGQWNAGKKWEAGRQQEVDKKWEASREASRQPEAEKKWEASKQEGDGDGVDWPSLGKLMSRRPRLHGTVKLYSAEKAFCFVACDETKAIFHRDVFISSKDLGEIVPVVGDKVSFLLRVDHGNRPRGLEVKMEGRTEAQLPEWKKTLDPDAVYLGSIKSFQEDTGFGFITCPELHEIFERDVFLHHSQLAGFSTGDQVRFRINVDPVKGTPKAKDLTAAPVAPSEDAQQVAPCEDPQQGTSCEDAQPVAEEARPPSQEAARPSGSSLGGLSAQSGVGQEEVRPPSHEEARLPSQEAAHPPTQEAPVSILKRPGGLAAGRRPSPVCVDRRPLAANAAQEAALAGLPPPPSRPVPVPEDEEEDSDEEVLAWGGLKLPPAEAGCPEREEEGGASTASPGSPGQATEESKASDSPEKAVLVEEMEAAAAQESKPPAPRTRASGTPGAGPGPWKRYALEEGVQAFWWWCEGDGDWFVEKSPEPWVNYEDPITKGTYWWKDESRWFWT